MASIWRLSSGSAGPRSLAPSSARAPYIAARLLAYFSPVLPQMGCGSRLCRRTGPRSNEAFVADVVNHATADTTTVVRDAIGMVAEVGLEDSVGEFDSG